jgi:hypothetical protein
MLACRHDRLSSQLLCRGAASSNACRTFSKVMGFARAQPILRAHLIDRRLWPRPTQRNNIVQLRPHWKRYRPVGWVEQSDTHHVSRHHASIPARPTIVATSLPGAASSSNGGGTFSKAMGFARAQPILRAIDMLVSAIQKYVRNDFEARELTLRSGSKVTRVFDDGRVLVSEVLQELLRRDYRYIISRYGFGLSLNGTAELDEVVKRFRQKLRYLYVHSYSKRWMRPDECLDFRSLTPLYDLRGLSVGYMLNSRNATAIEQLVNLEFLSLAWKN